MSSAFDWDAAVVAFVESARRPNAVVPVHPGLSREVVFRVLSVLAGQRFRFGLPERVSVRGFVGGGEPLLPWVPLGLRDAELGAFGVLPNGWWSWGGMSEYVQWRAGLVNVLVERFGLFPFGVTVWDWSGLCWVVAERVFSRVVPSDNYGDDISNVRVSLIDAFLVWDRVDVVAANKLRAKMLESSDFKILVLRASPVLVSDLVGRVVDLMVHGRVHAERIAAADALSRWGVSGFERERDVVFNLTGYKAFGSFSVDEQRELLLSGAVGDVSLASVAGGVPVGAVGDFVPPENLGVLWRTIEVEEKSVRDSAFQRLWSAGFGREFAPPFVLRDAPLLVADWDRVFESWVSDVDVNDNYLFWILYFPREALFALRDSALLRGRMSEKLLKLLNFLVRLEEMA